MKLRCGRKLYVQSVGIEAGAEQDPFATAVMKEIDVDISQHLPRSLDELAEGTFDLVITLAPDAHHHILELARTESVEVEFWPTLDATLTTGSRDQKIGAYRDVRNQLDDKIRARFSNWLKT